MDLTRQRRDIIMLGRTNCADCGKDIKAFKCHFNSLDNKILCIDCFVDSLPPKDFAIQIPKTEMMNR